MAKLTKVEGIGEVYAQKLRDAGIATTQALLKEGVSPQGRKEIAEKTGISGTLILRWVNHVDLFRVKGVGEEYADLLETAGVDTVPELAQRNPENLYQKLVAVNQEKKLVRQLPSQAQVSNWVEQAKQLPRVITY
jgi:predicted flap endonuclease-1-like 5' DNA nuclease